MFEDAQEWVRFSVEWLRLLVEFIGITIIAIGLVVAIRGLVTHWLRTPEDNFNPVRIAFARYLTLALEFQLAADILSTAIAPSWDQLGKLATVAVIRTGLNHFLVKEIREEQAAGGTEVKRESS